MKTDRPTKALLLAIAIGLWLNVVGQWMQPTPVFAQDSEVRDKVIAIANDVGKIAAGSCANGKIC